jgi:hypothetical protein
LFLSKYYLGDQINSKVMGVARSTYGLWWGNLKERHHLEDKGVDGRTILKWIFGQWDGKYTVLVWLRIGTDGGLLCMR